MATEHIKEDIGLYLSGALPENRRREIEAHMAGCEKCNQAMSRAKAKQARVKREALKKASPDRVPNLLLTRLGKQTGFGERPGRAPWGWLGIFLLVVSGLLMLGRKDFRRGSISKVNNAPAPESAVLSSSAPAQIPGAFEVTKTSNPIPTAPVTTPIVEATASQPATPPQAEAPQQWNGADSGIKDFREVIVKGRNSWRALWSEMQMEGRAPRVNFNDWIVVGVFGGEKAGGTQIVMSPPHEQGSDQVVTYKFAPAPAGQSPAPGHPYFLLTIPRTDKNIRFQSGS